MIITFIAFDLVQMSLLNRNTSRFLSETKRFFSKNDQNGIKIATRVP
ncbi:hypothetical protein FCR2A7T_02770 [Flavobacterium cauense R2A-7]|nr:hypothetical protein FCR2A7T_02770 [Flavobacterium cauense R2A-7]